MNDDSNIIWIFAEARSADSLYKNEKSAARQPIFEMTYSYQTIRLLINCLDLIFRFQALGQAIDVAPLQTQFIHQAIN